MLSVTKLYVYIYCFVSGMRGLFLSYNGGKDACVCLHLLEEFFKKTSKLIKKRLQCIYVRSSKAFEELDEFALGVVKRYILYVFRDTMSNFM